MSSIKNFVPSFNLILASFSGGMVLSMLELMNMCSNHENIGDPYFYLGMIIAGLLGIFGLVVSRSKDIGGAVTSGIAAPQILAGIAKSGAVVQTAFTLMFTPVYAQPQFIPSTDTLTITIISESGRSLEVRPTHETIGCFLNDTLKIKIPKNESLIFSGKGLSSSTLDFFDVDTQALVIVSLSIKEPKLGSGLLRGMFAQQMNRSKTESYQIDLKVSH